MVSHGTFAFGRPLVAVVSCLYARAKHRNLPNDYQERIETKWTNNREPGEAFRRRHTVVPGEPVPVAWRWSLVSVGLSPQALPSALNLNHLTGGKEVPGEDNSLRSSNNCLASALSVVGLVSNSLRLGDVMRELETQTHQRQREQGPAKEL